MVKISSWANITLLLVGLLSFLFLGVFKTWYYQELFIVKFSYFSATGLGFALALMIEGGRFAFMLSSAQDMLVKNEKGFNFGAVGSILFLLYEIKMCYSMGAYWGDETTYLYVQIFISVAILGAFIEARLCLMLIDPDNKEAEVGSKKGSIFFRTTTKDAALNETT